MKYWYNNQWNELTLNALDGMPIGSIIQFAGSVIPTGWLICDGSSLSEEEYPQLYDVIGHTYGGSGLSFNLPDFKGKVPVGQDTNDTDFNTLGETGGSKELQAHNHELRASDSYNYNGMVTTAYAGATGWAVSDSSVVSNGGSILDKYTKNAGTGDSGNLQPYLVVNYIIKATQTTPTFASVVNTNSNSTTDSYSCDYINDLLNTIFPVGKTEIFYDNEDHSNYLGFTWTRTAVGKTIVGIDTTQTEFDTIGETGGSKTTNISEQNMPWSVPIRAQISGTGQGFSNIEYSLTGWNWYANNSVHSQTGVAMNNLQPYEVFAVWRRTA